MRSTSKVQNTFHVSNEKIVAGHKCSTKRLSLFIDILLKDFLSRIKNNVKDNFQFPKKCKKKLMKTLKQVSFDGTDKLHELGLKAIRSWLDRYPELIS